MTAATATFPFPGDSTLTFPSSLASIIFVRGRAVLPGPATAISEPVPRRNVMALSTRFAKTCQRSSQSLTAVRAARSFSSRMPQLEAVDFLTFLVPLAEVRLCFSEVGGPFVDLEFETVPVVPQRLLGAAALADVQPHRRCGDSLPGMTRTMM